MTPAQLGSLMSVWSTDPDLEEDFETMMLASIGASIYRPCVMRMYVRLRLVHPVERRYDFSANGARLRLERPLGDTGYTFEVRLPNKSGTFLVSKRRGHVLSMQVQEQDMLFVVDETQVFKPVTI